MLDTPARIWDRNGEVVVVPPVPLRAFINQIRVCCPSARLSNLGWSVAQSDAPSAVELLRMYFPVIQDRRTPAAPAPRFVDGQLCDPFTQLDIVSLLTPIAPALCAIGDERHEARMHFSQLEQRVPGVASMLGFAESLQGQWLCSYAAQRFWIDLLGSVEDAIRASIQSDGSLCEQIDPACLRDYWLSTRKQRCGAVPTYLGERWYPTQDTLPFWIAALLACMPGPQFKPDEAQSVLQRTLPAWPMRVAGDLHRLDLKDAAHWPVSFCVLPGRQSQDGNDALLHLSCVNGVSKNRALWATILDGKRELIPLRVGHQRYHSRRVEGRKQYITAWNDEPLPTSGLSHLALTHRSAFEPELGQPFLHLAGNDATGAPDLGLFAQQLSRALSLPFDSAWAAQLWQYGTTIEDAETCLITPLPSGGCQGYWVVADEPRWTRLIVAIQRGIAPNELRDADLQINEIGATQRIDEVIEHADEDDADDASSADW